MAHAQPPPLQSALRAYALVAALDGVSTYQALQAGGHERNPLLSFAHDRPAPTVALNAASDLGTLLLWQRIGRQHPKLATIGLLSTTALRVWIVSHNVQTLRLITRN